MRTAIFIVGLGQWGKSSVLRKLLVDPRTGEFGLHIGCICDIIQGFIIQDPSNGDYPVGKYLGIIDNKLLRYRQNLDFISALNPSQSSSKNVQEVLEYFKKEKTIRDHNFGRYLFFYLMNKCDNTLSQSNRQKAKLTENEFNFIKDNAPENSEHKKIEIRPVKDSRENKKNAEKCKKEILKHLKTFYEL